MAVRYGKNYDYRVLVGKLIALAFVPHHLVYTCARDLHNTFEEEDKPLLDYFMKAWVGEMKVGKRNKKNADGTVTVRGVTWGKPIIKIEETNLYFTVRFLLSFLVEFQREV